MLHWVRSRKPRFPPMGVNKGGSTQILPLSSWATITNRVKRSGFPDTVIESDVGVKVPAGVTVEIVVQNTHGGSHSSCLARIFNQTTGEIVATSEATTTATPSVGIVYAPTVDSVIVAQGFVASGFSNRDNVLVGAGTYMTVTP